jgi:hypothetical protein
MELRVDTMVGATDRSRGLQATKVLDLLARLTKAPEREAYGKTREFKDGQRFRAGIEGRISVLFRGRGMKRCRSSRAIRAAGRRGCARQQPHEDCGHVDRPIIVTTEEPPDDSLSFSAGRDRNPGRCDHHVVQLTLLEIATKIASEYLANAWRQTSVSPGVIGKLTRHNADAV